ncbi:MAG: TonB-dependent receptor [Chitinophagaceae bacterium]|nr:TonB-dependent receptor [Chitinophagaceae bacterium]
MSKKILTLIAISASTFALAQQDTTSAKLLDDVVVTATKFPIKTSSTGKVITVITQQQLEQNGGKDLAQILTEQAGVFISGSNSNLGKDKSVYLRGARAEHTLITVDGVPLYDPSGIGNNFDIRNISINLIERVEILKGSQSTLYGSDAIAGVINIITKKSGNPSKPLSANALASYGSNNTLNANAGINIHQKNINYYAGYSVQKTDGINETISSNPNADKDGYEQTSLQTGMTIKASKNISVNPYFRYTKNKGDIDQGAFVDELDYTYDQKSIQAGVKNELQFGKTKLNILYNYNSIDRTYLDDSTKSQNGYDKYSKGTYKGIEHFIDVFANFTLDKKTSLTTGVDYRMSNSTQDFFSIGFFGPYKSSYSNDSLKQNQLAIYTALNFNNNKGFNLELGARFNRHSVYGNNWVFNFNPSYQVNDEVKVFANVSSGYKTPSLYQLFSEYGNKNLRPEVSLNTEVGLQHLFDHQNIKTQLVLFARNVNDVHFFYYNPSTFQAQYINQDKQKDYGVEFEASFNLSKNTTLRTYYTAVDGNINTKNANGKDTSYNNLLRRPKNSLGINLATKLSKNLSLTTNLNWFGPRSDAYFNSSTFKTEYVTLTSYALLDVYLEYAFTKHNVKAFVNARNIGNTSFTEISGYNTLGRNIYGGFRINF